MSQDPVFSKQKCALSPCSLPGLCGQWAACSWGWLKPNPFLPFGELGWTQWNLAASFSLVLRWAPLPHCPTYLNS